jgi:GT2 family glycosyltransferase
VLENPENGYAAALNLGLSEARGDFVVLSNNDVFPEPEWVGALLEAMQRDPKIGCAGGKLLFEDGRINSVWHRALPGYYWDDEGFGDVDRGQYESEREVDGVCWAAVMFRRACVDEVSPLEEDYVLYYEDVDASLCCRQAGWKIVYVPKAVARHRFHGSSTGTHLAEHYCDRNRLIFLAKYHPEELPHAIRSRSEPPSKPCSASSRRSTSSRAWR